MFRVHRGIDWVIDGAGLMGPPTDNPSLGAASFTGRWDASSSTLYYGPIPRPLRYHRGRPIHAGHSSDAN